MMLFPGVPAISKVNFSKSYMHFVTTRMHHYHGMAFNLHSQWLLVSLVGFLPLLEGDRNNSDRCSS